MATLLIKCPKTGKSLSTGFVVSEDAFDPRSFSNNAVGCPHCRQTHTWSGKDAFFEKAN